MLLKEESKDIKLNWMKPPFFTIIIPIYNNILFIEPSFQSLLEQSFHNFEIIFIDDGSTDGSFELLKKISENKSFINLFYQSNKGAGSARNLGIKQANGDYICFFDIDDKVNSYWLEKIYKLIIKEFPEVLVYSYNEINQKLNTRISFRFHDKFYEDNNSIKRDYVTELSGIKFNNGFVWNKAYKRDFLIKNNIKFPDLRIQQDEVFNHRVYKTVNSLLTSSEILYDYYVYDRGNTRNSYIPERLKIFQQVKESFFTLSKHWELKNRDLNYYIHSRFVKNSLYNRNPKSSESRSIFRNKLFINDSFKESARYMLEYPKGLSKIERLYLKGIINNSKFLFSIAETANLSIPKAKALYHKLKR